MALPITAAGFSWTHTDRDQPAVGPLDLQIAAGEKVLLLGASGAGKSTFLHAVAGVLLAQAYGMNFRRLDIEGHRMLISTI